MSQGMMLTTADAEALWGTDRKYIASYCKKHAKDIGAEKRGGRWYVPADAVLPTTVGDAKHFLQAYLQYKDNPADAFDWTVASVQADKTEPFLEGLLKCQLIALRDVALPVSLDNLFVTTRGRALVFGDQKSKALRRFVIDLSINPQFGINFNF